MRLFKSNRFLGIIIGINLLLGATGCDSGAGDKDAVASDSVDGATLDTFSDTSSCLFCSDTLGQTEVEPDDSVTADLAECTPCKPEDYPEELQCATLICDQQQCLRVVQNAGVDCDDGNPCTQNVCDLETGRCANPAEPAGRDCSAEGDTDPCTHNEQCNGEGLCVGTPIDCDTLVPCSASSEPLRVGDQCLCKADIPNDTCVFTPGMSVDCMPEDGVFSTNPDCSFECIKKGGTDASGCWTCPATGVMKFSDNEDCDDGDGCTLGDRCEPAAAACVGIQKTPYGIPANAAANAFLDKCEELEPGCPLIPGVPEVFARVVTKAGWCVYDDGLYTRECVEEEESPTENECLICAGGADGLEIVDVSDGQSCDDGDSSTYADSCKDGKCIGVKCVCDSSDVALCAERHCVADGSCSEPMLKTPGYCLYEGLDPVTHVSAFACVADGTEIPGSPCEVCSAKPGQTPVAKPRPAYTSCHTGNCCESAGTCDGNGSCQGMLPVQCPVQECNVGACNPEKCVAGSLEPACEYAPIPSSRSLGSLISCTTRCGTEGRCSVGECVSDDCNPGMCTAGACDDGDYCTENDICSEGYCLPGTPKVCSSSDPCKTASCDPATGECVESAALDGTPCNNDNNLCTQEVCHAGQCKAASSVSCPAPDSDCQTSSCVPSTGECVTINLPDGISCDDGDPCSLTDRCVSGSCVPQGSVVCVDDLDDCLTPYCDKDTGTCGYSTLPAQTACFDGNLKTDDDHCNSTGACVTGSAAGGQLLFSGANAFEVLNLGLNGSFTLSIVARAALTGPNPYEVLAEMESPQGVVKFCVATAQIKPTSLGVTLSKGQLFVLLETPAQQQVIMACDNGYGKALENAWDVVALTVDGNGQAKVVGSLAVCELKVKSASCDLDQLPWPQGSTTLRVGGTLKNGQLQYGFHGTMETLGVFAEALPVMGNPFSISCFRNEGRDYSESLVAIAVYKFNELAGDLLISGTGEHDALLNSVPGVAGPSRVQTGEAFPNACIQ